VIYELRTYQLKVGAVQKYLQQFEHKGLPIISKYGTLVGYWTVDTGVLHRVIHIWSYNDLEHRQRARRQCMQDKDWTEGYLPLATPLIEAQESVIMSAANFSPIR
jgi:hypothetical protein